MPISYLPSFKKAKEGSSNPGKTSVLPKNGQTSSRKPSIVVRAGQAVIGEAVVRTKPNHKPLHSHWGSNPPKRIRPIDSVFPPSVSWDDLDPSFHPKNSTSYDFQDMIRDSLNQRGLLTDEMQVALERHQISARQTPPRSTRPRDGPSFKKRSDSTRRRATPGPSEQRASRRATPAPQGQRPDRQATDPPAVLTKDGTIALVPISKFSSSANALSRAACTTASMTAASVAQRHHHEPRKSDESLASRYGHKASKSEGAISHVHGHQMGTTEGEGVPHALNRSSLDLAGYEGAHEIMNGATASERHQANKRLYHKMKAENHNLWVLLDASNRRANLMMETLHAEEQRCRTLEVRAATLQATLDTLNARRLWQDQRAETPSVYDVPTPQPDTADVAQITAELEHIRQNIAQSRCAIRELGDASATPVPVPGRSPDEDEVVRSQDALHKTIHHILEPHVQAKHESVASFAALEQLNEQLDEHLLDLVRPRPVRPVLSTSLPIHGGPEDSSVYETQDDTGSELLASFEHVSEGSGTATPGLSAAGSSRTSLDGSTSPELPLSPTPPPPPPKNGRRIQSKAHIERRLKSLAHVHPALRADVAVTLEEVDEGVVEVV